MYNLNFDYVLDLRLRCKFVTTQDIYLAACWRSNSTWFKHPSSIQASSYLFLLYFQALFMVPVILYLLSQSGYHSFFISHIYNLDTKKKDRMNPWMSFSKTVWQRFELRNSLNKGGMACSWVLMNRIFIKSDLRDIVPRCQRRQWHPTPVLLLGKSHGWRSLVGCSPWGCEELDTTEWLHFHFSLSCTGEGNGNPLPCSCLENPSDGGAWWAAVYGVAQSRTRLKWLSSSSSTQMQ